MSQEERLGTRDQSYSVWHRRFSTQRFVGIERAQLLAMIDLDASLWVEYDDRTKDPLALIETAIDTGKYKAATVITKLAQRARLPSYCVLYTLSDKPNPADKSFRDIVKFRVKQLTPTTWPDWKDFTPEEWCQFLLYLRNKQCRVVDYEITRDRNQILAQGVSHA
jgi:hypothetical protein